MSAPKMPVGTGAPSSRSSAAANAANFGWASSGGVVGEDAQRDDLAREPVAVVVAVVRRHAGQHEQARPDRGDAAAVDGDRGLAHALDEGAHRRG